MTTLLSKVWDAQTGVGVFRKQKGAFIFSVRSQSRSLPTAVTLPRIPMVKLYKSGMRKPACITLLSRGKHIQLNQSLRHLADTCFPSSKAIITLVHIVIHLLSSSPQAGLWLDPIISSPGSGYQQGLFPISTVIHFMEIRWSLERMQVSF